MVLAMDSPKAIFPPGRKLPHLGNPVWLAPCPITRANSDQFLGRIVWPPAPINSPQNPVLFENRVSWGWSRMVIQTMCDFPPGGNDANATLFVRTTVESYTEWKTFSLPRPCRPASQKADLSFPGVLMVGKWAVIRAPPAYGLPGLTAPSQPRVFYAIRSYGRPYFMGILAPPRPIPSQLNKMAAAADFWCTFPIPSSHQQKLNKN